MMHSGLQGIAKSGLPFWNNRMISPWNVGKKEKQRHQCKGCGRSYKDTLRGREMLGRVPEEWGGIYPEDDICYFCLFEAERMYISYLTRAKLPLELNRPWLFEASKDLFLKKRDELLGVGV